jgi:hypothetical protein
MFNVKPLNSLPPITCIAGSGKKLDQQKVLHKFTIRLAAAAAAIRLRASTSHSWVKSLSFAAAADPGFLGGGGGGGGGDGVSSVATVMFRVLCV